MKRWKRVKKFFKKIWRPPHHPLYLCPVIQIIHPVGFPLNNGVNENQKKSNGINKIKIQNKMKKSIFTLLLMVAFATFTATAQTADNKTDGNEQVVKTQDNATETAQAKLDKCPLKGTSDCPLVKNCPKKGQSDCPYKTNSSKDNSATAQNSDKVKPSCCKKGKPSCCAKK